MSTIVERPSLLKVVQAVGWVTFLEVVRDKVLYNILLCAALLFGIGFLAARLTFVHPDRVIMDFGLTALSLSSAMIAVFTGSGLLGREIERRTIYVALSHPISRLQFVIGKYAGLALVLFANWGLLSLSYLCILMIAKGNVGEVFQVTLFQAVLMILIQSLLIASISIFFSSFSTTSLSVVFTIGLYLIGQNISEIRLVAAKTESQLAQITLNSIALSFPNLEYFNLGTKVTYSLPVSASFVWTGLAYGAALISLFLLLAGIFVQAREV